MSRKALIAVSITLTIVFWGCNLLTGSPAPKQEATIRATDTQETIPPSLPSEGAEPTQAPPQFDTPIAPTCSLNALSDMAVYMRPSTEADVFGTLSAGMVVDALARTADGWLGFDPGVAQAANSGVFRLRWVQMGISIGTQGDCDALSLVSAPPPGICFALPIDKTLIFAAPDASAAPVSTLGVNDYAAVIGKSANNWYRVDMALGSPASNEAGWISGEMINLNGPCEALPLISIPAGERFTPSGLSCTLTADACIAAYARPSLEADFFGNFQTDMSVAAGARTAEGWIGFDPGVAQAANIGIFRLRWVAPDAAFTLSGDCSALPIMVGPPPKVCFTMAMGDIPILEEPRPFAPVVAMLYPDEYAAVIARSIDDWYRVDLGFGNAASNQAGWLQGNLVNLNGLCDNLPLASP